MGAEDIQQVRRFNRVVTRRVGALQESYLKRGRPLGEARLIFEVGLDGADVRDLRNRLGLDSGYLSRLVKSVQAQGLIRIEAQSSDARVRRVCLTEAGRAELAVYDALSDRLAETMLAALDADQRSRLVKAMNQVERLLRAADVDIRLEAPSSADARWCLEEYYRELARRFETGFDPHRGKSVADADMTPPGGYLFVARLDGNPVGCGVLMRTDETTGEAKRIWTAAAARGLGIARRMLRTLEATAREAGMRTLQLDTNRSLSEAQALYRSEGYVEVAAFNDNPYAHHWFQKIL